MLRTPGKQKSNGHQIVLFVLCFWYQKLPFGLKNNLVGQITFASWLGKRNIPFLRGCIRVAQQAPMWVVVRPARSKKEATCLPKGSVKTQQGGAWGRGRRRGGVTLIFGAEVLKGRVIPIISMSINSVVFVIITSAWKGVGWPESARNV